MAFIQSLSHFISSGISYRRDSSPSPYVLSTSPPDSTMELYLLEHRLQVCAIAKSDIQYFCYAIIKIALLPEARPNFFSITESNGLYTVILTDEDYKEFPSHHSLKNSNHRWRVLTVSVGAMGVSNELVGISKISKSVIGPLSDHKISVLCVSTYQSDFILVQENQLNVALRVLGNYFKIFNEDHKRVTDNQLACSSPKTPDISAVLPICHPFRSPKSVFCVTGLDASKLSGVVQLLLELIFFSGNQKENNGDSFFHFSVVCGDISLIINKETLEKFPNNVLYTRKNEESWRMVIIGDDLGFDECGIVAQVVDPLASALLSTYYVSTYNMEYCMVLESDIDRVLELFAQRTLDKLKIEENSTIKSISQVESSELRPGEVQSFKSQEVSITNLPELQFSSSP